MGAVWVPWMCLGASLLPCACSGRSQRHTTQGSAIQPAPASLPGSRVSRARVTGDSPARRCPQAAQRTLAWKRSLFPAGLESGWRKLWGLPVARRALSTGPELKHGPQGRGEPTGLTWFQQRSGVGPSCSGRFRVVSPLPAVTV